MPKASASFLFTALLFLFPSHVFSDSPAGDPLKEVLVKVRSIEDRLYRIETGQKEIFARDDEIHAKLKEIWVWASRRQRLVAQS